MASKAKEIAACGKVFPPSEVPRETPGERLLAETKQLAFNWDGGPPQGGSLLEDKVPFGVQLCKLMDR